MSVGGGGAALDLCMLLLLIASTIYLMYNAARMCRNIVFSIMIQKFFLRYNARVRARFGASLKARLR